MNTVVITEESMDLYVGQINTYPILSRQDELDLAYRYKNCGDLMAIDHLTVANLRFVVKIAHEYRGYGFKLLDLVQEGNIGLLIAVKKFEPSKGYRLISYAVWWIRAYIQNFIMRSWSLVKLGTTQAQRKLFFKLRSEKQQAELSNRAGFVQDHTLTSQLAHRLQVGEKDIIDMEMRLASRDFSLDSELQEGAKETHMDLLENVVNKGNQEESYAEQEYHSVVRAWVKKLMNYMNEKERYIIENRLMSDEPKTLQEIGRHFAISRERARQIEGNVLRKIKHMLIDANLSLNAV